jgi:hypothetical protein
MVWNKFILALSMAIFFNLSTAHARTRIAFLESYNSQGKLIQYEPGGRFAHTAIQFDEIGDRWLNAYPKEGVALISWEELNRRGIVAEIVEIPQQVKASQVMPLLGRPFDYWYSWSDDALYCSELIAKIFNISTQPMKFNREVWPKNYWHLEGLPGASPDQIWLWAQKQAM